MPATEVKPDACPNCEATFEVKLAALDSDDPIECPDCGEPLQWEYDEDTGRLELFMDDEDEDFEDGDILIEDQADDEEEGDEDDDY